VPYTGAGLIICIIPPYPIIDVAPGWDNPQSLFILQFALRAELHQVSRAMESCKFILIYSAQTCGMLPATGLRMIV